MTHKVRINGEKGFALSLTEREANLMVTLLRQDLSVMDENIQNFDTAKSLHDRLHRQLMDNSFGCLDCSVNTNTIHEYYMVKDPIWKQTGLAASGGMLCIGCLEARIGRRLTQADFITAPINAGFFSMSERMRDRLGLGKAAA